MSITQPRHTHLLLGTSGTTPLDKSPHPEGPLHPENARREGVCYQVGGMKAHLPAQAKRAKASWSSDLPVIPQGQHGI